MITKSIEMLTTVLAILTLSAAIAQAQSPATGSQAEREPEFKVTAFLARMQEATRGRLQRGSFGTSGSAAASSTFSPAATGPNLQVLGGGTLGRLTKWTGFTSTNSFIGDTTIFEDKYGKVGIGTDTPTSRLTVSGMIESTSSGFKFPDGTIQSTSASGSLLTVTHDATLTGAGTGGSPLGVSVPLMLTGPSAIPILSVVNSGGSNGVDATGGPGSDGVAGHGGANQGNAGTGVVGVGGASSTLEGGFGLVGIGGDSAGFSAGIGVRGRGGASGFSGGIGVQALGGDGNTFGGSGGSGLSAIGGGGVGANRSGGDGIEAFAGAGLNGADPGLAGFFGGDVKINGNLDVTGNVSKGGGSFKIDHPLDPENKYLFHSFVESPDMMNIYNGNVTTDGNGEATVRLPDYFEALNSDFRYQLTVIGQFAQSIVSSEIKDNRFVIRTSEPGVKVSWQVTGIRRDAWAMRNRIKVEVEKDDKERGHYLHPEAFDQPGEKSIEWALHPGPMQRMKAMLEQTKRQNQWQGR